VFDGAFGVAGGVLRGCGQLRKLAVINVVTLWGVGVGGGFVMTFPLGLKIVGVWLGLALGCTVGSLIMLYVIWHLDWPVEATRAARAVETLSSTGPAVPSLGLLMEPISVDSSAAVECL
jgi:MATE family multidrug resistance protein